MEDSESSGPFLGEDDFGDVGVCAEHVARSSVVRRRKTSQEDEERGRKSSTPSTPKRSFAAHSPSQYSDGLGVSDDVDTSRVSEVDWTQRKGRKKAVQRREEGGSLKDERLDLFVAFPSSRGLTSSDLAHVPQARPERLVEHSRPDSPVLDLPGCNEEVEDAGDLEKERAENW